MTVQKPKTGELRIALHEVVFQIPWLAKSTFGQLLDAETTPPEIDQFIRRLCKKHIIECRIQNAVICEQLRPLIRPAQISEEFLSQVKDRSEMQSRCVAKPVVLVRASRLTASLTGREFSHDLSFDEMNATLRLGEAVRCDSNEYGNNCGWKLHKRGSQNKFPALIASFTVPKALRRRYCVVPLPLSFRTAENLIRSLQRSGVDYEIW